MSLYKSVGVSKHTPRKQDCFAKFLEWHMTPLELKEYWYIDMTAGEGISESGDLGSAASFLAIISAFNSALEQSEDHHFNVVLFERDKDSFIRLLSTTKEYAKEKIDLNYHRSDNMEFINIYKNSNIHEGLIYVDPNGNIPSYEELTIIGKNFPELDMLLHISVTSHKRAVGHFGKPGLEESLTLLPYKNIAFTRPEEHHRWMFVFLTNSSLKDKGVEDLGFCLSDSPEGEDIVRTLRLRS